MDRLTTSSTHLELQIEELILQGFPGCDRDRIGSVITQELTRLFTEQGIPQSLENGVQPIRLAGGSFQIPTGNRVDRMGTQIAQEIYGGFEQGGTKS